MSGKNIIFNNEKINKKIFYKNNHMVQKRTIWYKKSSEYFIGSNDNDVIRPLCIKLPQMIGLIKYFDSNKRMSFKVNDNKLLKKYTKIWEKVSSSMNIKFDSEPIYGDND